MESSVGPHEEGRPPPGSLLAIRGAADAASSPGNGSGNPGGPVEPAPVTLNDGTRCAPFDRLDFRCHAFRRTHFPRASREDWQDWRWQLGHSVRDTATLSGMLRLSPDEWRALEETEGGFPFRLTPYYASLLDPADPSHPLRRTVVPDPAERRVAPCESVDPLEEDADSPVPGLVHRYPDRVLFLVTGECATYCRYCTRSRAVGRRSDETTRPEMGRWKAAIAYIRSQPAVRDVLLSGGDPLTLADERLAWLLDQLRTIPHVEIIRIGTKIPVVLPQRITPELVQMLRRFHPLWMSLHFTHPAELTPEVRKACSRLADAGIPLGSQTVLLAGVNDDVEVLTRLFQWLLRMRVRPYYLYQCDLVPGSGHFRTPVRKGLEILQGLRGHTSGYAVPTYVIDAPGGGGKIPLLPEYVVGAEGGDLLLRNYEGRIYRYPERV